MTLAERAVTGRVLRITLTAWRQAGPDQPGAFETYDVPGVFGYLTAVLLVAIENARFRKPVVPGDTLRMEMKILKRKATVAKMSGVATVDGVLVAEAEMMCKLADK
jgi:3-hydroxymyristoyl/3-hydroxydecanoyl-(acyl carrier protein) dehydratase